MSDRTSTLRYDEMRPNAQTNEKLILLLGVGLVCLSVWLLHLRMYVPREWGDEGCFVPTWGSFAPNQVNLTECVFGSTGQCNIVI